MTNGTQYDNRSQLHDCIHFGQEWQARHGLVPRLGTKTLDVSALDPLFEVEPGTVRPGPTPRGALGGAKPDLNGGPELILTSHFVTGIGQPGHA